VEEKRERGIGKGNWEKGEDEDTTKFGNESIPSMNMEISAICECCHCRQSSKSTALGNPWIEPTHICELQMTDQY